MIYGNNNPQRKKNRLRRATHKSRRRRVLTNFPLVTALMYTHITVMMDQTYTTDGRMSVYTPRTRWSTYIVMRPSSSSFPRVHNKILFSNNLSRNSRHVVFQIRGGPINPAAQPSKSRVYRQTVVSLKHARSYSHPDDIV